MGAVMAAEVARPVEESSRAKAVADDNRGVRRTKWMQNLEGNLVLNSVTVLVACKLAIFVGGKIVARAKTLAAAKRARRDDRWSMEMPPELLSSITDSLSLADCMSFLRVCKGWRLAPFSRSEIANFSHHKPWLLFYGLDDKDDTCYLYSESHPKCCTLKLPGLRGATCLESMYGWILARRGRRFFFYNPLSMEKVELAAEYPHNDAAEQVYAFEGCPSSPNCTAIVVSRRGNSIVEICSCRVGTTEWRTDEVSVGGSEFGPLRYVNTCYLANGVIKVCTDSAVLSYNITNKNCNCRYSSLYTEDKNTFDGIKAVHQNDWLFQFGKGEGEREGGISVSTCGLRMNFCDSGGIMPSTFVVASGMIEEEGELKNVQAVWVQPPGYKNPTLQIMLSKSVIVLTAGCLGATYWLIVFDISCWLSNWLCRTLLCPMPSEL